MVSRQEFDELKDEVNELRMLFKDHFHYTIHNEKTSGPKIQRQKNKSSYTLNVSAFLEKQKELK